MAQKAVKNAIKEITFFLGKNYEGIKFTVKFNGEFFIAGADKSLEKKELKNLPRCMSEIEIEENRIFICAGDEWAKEVLGTIEPCECAPGSMRISSQVARLEKQLEFGLAGGSWSARQYAFAKSLLYLLHTKSRSIRLNIVKNCETEYNRMQRLTKIPEELIIGYANALCQISRQL